MIKKTMKIVSPLFQTLFTPELRSLSNLFEKNNYELRMAGGAVRDLLMNIKPSDVDFASTATPDQIKAMFEKEEIRMLHKKGENHGTITCRINDKENFEITTLRIDLVCDGRRAEVKFTTDWALDAFRRDLTINSLFLDLNGTIYDYTGGIDDVINRKITFVGDPTQRIQEDYLRILRYFRFFGRISIEPHIHDKKNIDAIIECKDGLSMVSGERIWVELNQILIGRFAGDIIETMLINCSLASLIGLNKNEIRVKVIEFQRVAQLNFDVKSGKVNCKPATMLAALVSDKNEIDVFRSRTKISNNEYYLAHFIVERRIEANKNKNNANYFKHLLLDLIFENSSELENLLFMRCQELMKYVGAFDCLNEFNNWKIPKFPINGLMLLNAKVEKGKRMKAVLKHLFETWKKSDLQLNELELLKHINDLSQIASTEKLQENAPKFKKYKFM